MGTGGRLYVASPWDLGGTTMLLAEGQDVCCLFNPDLTSLTHDRLPQFILPMPVHV
jgi:hypothetical protein